MTQPRFWVGPLVAGCCFALGYGITDRVLTLQTNAEDPAPQTFAPLAFPGNSLREIRSRFSDDDAALQVDLTALEAAEAATRSANPAVKTTTKPDLALQTPQPPVWTTPAWSDPQSIAPEDQLDLQPDVPEADGSAPSTAQEQELDDGSTEPLVTPEPSEIVPAAVVPADDSPVLLAEPDSAVVPPGAEAFFETIEPVIPPQP
ncbi:hypothetical protein [Synechococcus sp. UW69]|uniref:hypothetical protein n=1 Tax=Synechococcus sp. UW69 TaxID=368493 RepID=UPI001FCADBBA|nr:hypothetical protein [Synechococcus sp. UW69]